MPSPFLQCRVDKETRERAEQAAADCALPVGTWLRTVVDDALDAHFDVELVPSESTPGVVYEVRRTLGLCSCPGFENVGYCKHLEPEPSEEPEADERPLDPSLVAAMTESVVVPRVEHPDQGRPVPSTPDPGPRRLSPRECPHLPQWRNASGSCTGCGSRPGARVGARLTR